MRNTRILSNTVSIPADACQTASQTVSVPDRGGARCGYSAIGQGAGLQADGPGASCRKARRFPALKPATPMAHDQGAASSTAGPEGRKVAMAHPDQIRLLGATMILTSFAHSKNVAIPREIDHRFSGKLTTLEAGIFLPGGAARRMMQTGMVPTLSPRRQPCPTRDLPCARSGRSSG